MPSRKTRVAVVGAGNMGRNHLRNYFLLPEFELVGLADIDPNTKTVAEEYKAKHYTDFELMMDELKPNAVSIVVPTPFHARVATAALSRGIHCLVEKPIASTVKEADELIKLAKKQKVIFTVGHIEHYNPLIRKLKQMVDEGSVGKVTSVVCKRVGGFPAVEPKTDVIIDLAVHDIDIVSHLLGQQPKRIYSHGSRTHHSREIDSAEILMDYGDASGFVQANWLTPVKIRTIAITGSEGYLEGNYITQELEYYKHNMQKLESGFSNFVIKVGEPQKRIIKVDFEEPLAVELKAFYDKIQGDNTVHLVDPGAAREALRLALEAVGK
ncbi:MAG TPA: Gfo/Idh/MocA family oxidoreductase [Verrucomicrobiae bacterium]|nr:Gfo/Idh/MocA family oxidoreductase [Verrucomicrobiae bacterium]